MGDVNLGSIKAKLEVDASGVDESVNRATGALNRFSESATQSASAIGQSVVAWQQLFRAAEAGVGALFGAYNASIQLAHQLTNLSARTQVGVEALQKYKLAGDDVGVSIERLSGSIFRMQKGLAGGKQDSLLRQLGLDPEQLRAAAPEKTFEAIGTAILKVGSAAQQAALSTKLLGDRGGQALQFLRAGGLEAANEMERLGVVMSTKTITALQEVWAQADDLNDVWQGLVRNVALTIAPVEAQAGAMQGLKEALGVASKALQDWNAEQERSPDLQARTAQATFNWAAGMVDVAHAVVAAWYGIKAGVSDILAWLAEKLASFGELQANFVATLAKAPGPQQEALQEYAKTLQAGVDFYKSWSYAENQASKDSVAAADKTLSAIEAIQKRLAGHKVGANVALPKPGTTTVDTGSIAAAEAAAKKLQAEMDKLSGAKAQGEMDLIAAAVKRLGIDGVADIDALGKQLLKLSAEGATVPPALIGAWSDAMVKELGNLKLPSEEPLNKYAEDAWSGYLKTVQAGSKQAEEPVKQHFENLKLLEQNQGDILEAQYDLGLISTKEYYTQVGQMQVNHYRKLAENARAAAAIEKDPAVRAALLAEAEAFERIAKAAGKAAAEITRAAQMSKLFGQFGQILNGISDVFDAIGISADSAIGKIVSGLQTATASVQDFASQTTTAGKIGSGLSAAAGIYKTGQEKGVAAGAISGAATGAAIGTMIAPGIGTVIGGAAGIIIGIAGGLRKPEYKKIMADVGKSWGVSISEGLAKEIEQIAKANKISRSLAELMSVSKIMGESGKDPREFTGKINDLMNAIKSGAVPAKEGLAELGKAFTMVADAAVAAGTVGDKAMVGLIKRARELGQVTPEMKAFVGAQLDSALAGIQKYVGAIEKLKDSATTTPEKFAAIGKTSGVVFGAMFDAMVSERGIVGAVDAMKDSYNTLHETLMSTLGPEAVSAILGPFGGAFATLQDETLRPIFEGIDGITQAMTGLANAGYLSTDQFVAMQDATAQLFDEAVAGGADMRTALLAVAPGIQAAISAAEQFGIPLDADMARLKALAEQNDITFATDPQAAMLDVLISIAQVLGADVPESARRAAESMRDLASSVPSNLDVNVNVNRNYRDNYSGGDGGGGEGGEGGGGGEPVMPPETGGGEPYEGYEGYAGGTGGFKDFGPGTPVVLHGKEAVITPDQAQSMAGGTSITLSPTFTGDPLMSNEGRKDLSQFQVEEFVRQVRNSPYIQQILRQGGLR
ncbi:MAG: hypothetical protein RL409_216 [Gemmatimonadota bacterium]